LDRNGRGRVAVEFGPATTELQGLPGLDPELKVGTGAAGVEIAVAARVTAVADTVALVESVPPSSRGSVPSVV
jgi:hypothetical protein